MRAGSFGSKRNERIGARRAERRGKDGADASNHQHRRSDAEAQDIDMIGPDDQAAKRAGR
jgi:hypothetical protein